MTEAQYLLPKRTKQDDIVTASYVCCIIPSSWVLLDESEHPDNSNISTLFLLLNNMIGSGILAQAYVFMTAGIAVTTASYLVTGVVIYMGTDMLIRSAEEASVFEYGELARECLGWWGETLVDTAVLISTIGGLVAYVIILGSLANSVASQFFPSAWYTQAWCLSSALVLVLVAPMCLIRRFGHLAEVSYASIAAVASVMLLVVVYGPTAGIENRDDHLVWYSESGYFSTIGTVVFAFGYINALFPALKGMRRAEPRLLTRISALTCVVGGCMCFVTGIVGYWSFRSSTSDNIIENFTGVAGNVFKVVIILHLILYIPADFVIMRHSAFKLVGADAEHSPDHAYIAVTLLLLVLVVVTANAVNYYSSSGLALVLELTGGIAGSLLNLLIPALCFYVACVREGDWLDTTAVVTVVIYGVFVLSTTTISMFI